MTFSAFGGFGGFAGFSAAAFVIFAAFGSGASFKSGFAALPEAAFLDAGLVAVLAAFAFSDAFLAGAAALMAAAFGFAMDLGLGADFDFAVVFGLAADLGLAADFGLEAGLRAGLAADFGDVFLTEALEAGALGFDAFGLEALDVAFLGAGLDAFTSFLVFDLEAVLAKEPRSFLWVRGRAGAKIGSHAASRL